jgi:hypothetical protein
MQRADSVPSREHRDHRQHDRDDLIHRGEVNGFGHVPDLLESSRQASHRALKPRQQLQEASQTARGCKTTSARVVIVVRDSAEVALMSAKADCVPL